ncbi:MAG: NADH-quinone oxidoreductase subunit J [Armatimonadota bacterium]
MDIIFILAALVAVGSTVMVITRLNAIHALLYLITSLLAVAVIFYVLGAPFIAALEVIIYAGAIMVLFIFVVMMLNLGPHAEDEERRLFTPGMLIGPGILALVLFGLTAYALVLPRGAEGTGMIPPQEVGIALYGPYLICVELSSFLLLAGLVGGYHLARRTVLGRGAERV